MVIDYKNRVVVMHFSGSGTESEYVYTYNDKIYDFKYQ